ncbi:hypothetical protein HDU84_005683 [Entophlyctis sp. JEL0112]|nr:hypothetical protein HDU84_005683 [Entophlyctis sp. JEL0112]
MRPEAQQHQHQHQHQHQSARQQRKHQRRQNQDEDQEQRLQHETLEHTDEAAAAAVQLANALLATIGVSPAVLRIEHVGECVPSLFVALYEGIARTRLSNTLHDAPLSTAARRDAQLRSVREVAACLEAARIPVRADPMRVVAGDPTHVSRLMFALGDFAMAMRARMRSDSRNDSPNLAPAAFRRSVRHAATAELIKSLAPDSPTESPEHAATGPDYSVSTRGDSQDSLASRETTSSLRSRRVQVLASSAIDASVRVAMVDDVEQHELSAARRSDDKAWNSRIEGAVNTLKSKRNAPSESPGIPAPSKIRFHLPPTSVTPKTTASRTHHSSKSRHPPSPPDLTRVLLQVEASDTPHTRALKLRQQRLVAARNAARTRADAAVSWSRQSLKENRDGPKKSTAHDSRRPLGGVATTNQTLSNVADVENAAERTRTQQATEESDESQSHDQTEDTSLMELKARLNVEPDSSGAFFESAAGPPADDSAFSVFSFDDSDLVETSGGDFEASQNVFSRITGIDEDFSAAKNDGPPSKEPRDDGDDGESSSNDRNDGVGPVGFDAPVSVAEQNFAAFENLVKTELFIKEVPKETKSVTWTRQIRDRKRSLDARLFERKRNLHKEISKFSDTRPVKLLRTDIEKSARQNKLAREREAQRQAKIAQVEQKRRVIRMEHRVRKAQSEVDALLQKRKMKEADLARQLYDAYLSSQREIIRDVSRFDRDQRKRREDAENMQREAKEAFTRDQIKLLEQELKDAKWEESVIVKAHAEEMRKLIREQKAAARENIRSVKEKLALDATDFELRHAGAANVMRKLKFQIQRQI